MTRGVEQHSLKLSKAVLSLTVYFLLTKLKSPTHTRLVYSIFGIYNWSTYQKSYDLYSYFMNEFLNRSIKNNPAILHFISLYAEDDSDGHLVLFHQGIQQVSGFQIIYYF